MKEASSENRVLAPPGPRPGVGGVGLSVGSVGSVNRFGLGFGVINIYSLSRLGSLTINIYDTA